MRRFPFRKTFLIVLLLVLGTWGLVEMAAWRAGNRLEVRFSTLADGLSVEVRYPPTQQNDTADGLEEIGTSLGMLMTSFEDKETLVPSDEAAASWDEAQGWIRELLLEVRRQGADPLPPTNLDLVSFLAREATTLDRLRTILRTEEVPVWPRDLSAGFEAKIPNYLGVMSLQRLLIVDALEGLRRGDEVLAMESMEASWRLNVAISDHPYLISQLVAVAVFNEQVPLLLRMGPMSSLWQERLRDFGPLSGMRRGLELEAWVAYASAREGRLEMTQDRWVPRIARSYLRWGLYNYAGHMLDIVDDLPNEQLTTFDSKQSFDEHIAAIPRWNVVGRLMIPNFYNAWVKAARAELALELVQRVSRLRETIAAGELESVPSRQASVLGDLFWEVAFTSAEVEIRLDGDLEAVHENPLPLSYRLAISEAVQPTEAASE